MNLVFIEDKNGNKVLPITSFSSVRDTNGNNLNLVLLTKVNSSEKGLNNGIATLDNNGKIPSSLISIDSTPTNNSDNPITSGAVYEALEGKQATIDNNHKLDADLVDDTNSTNKFTNSTEKGTWNGKQDKINVSGLLKGDGEGGVSTAISGTDYVAPVTGKGLSTNDYDDAAKNKVNSIPNSPIYTDTTYSLEVGTGLDANKIILTPSTGEPDKITVPYATTAGSASANGGNAATVNNHSVNTDVPANAVFTDTHHDGSVIADNGYVLTKVEVSSVGVWSKELVAIPDELSDLQDDSSHRTVTDTEKTNWNGKQAKITANGILKGDGNGGVSAALKQDIVDLGIPSTDTNTTYKLKIGSTTNGDSVNGVDLGTLENKSAASGGTDLSLVTTGEKYIWNNKASLDNSGKVPSSQLPSYVDDVLEYATMSEFPATGESGKIYVDLSTDRTYRWSGTQYTPIKGDLAIGSTTGTAADGGIVNTHITDSTIHVTSAKKEEWDNKQKAIAEGRGITITTGADADTVSLNLPIYAGSGDSSIAEGYLSVASGDFSHAEGYITIAGGDFSHTEGMETRASGYYSHAEGMETKASGESSHAEGYYTTTSNDSEHASGRYNVSNKASTTFGDSGNTLFSVGNGTASKARHNAFEIRQNGDIYLTLGGQDVKLQDNLGNKVDKTTTVNGHALSGNVTVTKSDVELGNVGNFKAVSTESNQGLTSTEQSNARANIGAGTSNFSGSYNDLSDKPTIPSAVTETTVANWGFTKNEGTVTSVKIGNTPYNPSSGVVSLPGYPTSLPANGGNSATVNNHTVLSDVPANAVFTDTNTWRPLGTGATDACAGNDSRLSDARVASNMIANYTEVSSNTSGVTTSLTQDGSETKVYYNSGSAAVTVSFATSGLVFTDGNDSMEIPAGGYGEVNFLRVTTGNTTRVFVRSIVSE